MIRFAVSREITATRGAVFSVLGEVERHPQVGGGRVDVAEISRDAEARMLGMLVLRGPFGVRRRIAVREVVRASPRLLAGVAAASTGSLALVSWELTEPARGMTLVTLSVVVVDAVLADRALALVGGRRLLRAVLGEALVRLETAVVSAELVQAVA